MKERMQSLVQWMAKGLDVRRQRDLGDRLYAPHIYPMHLHNGAGSRRLGIGHYVACCFVRRWTVEGPNVKERVRSHSGRQRDWI